MEKIKTQILLPSEFIKEDGTFDLEQAKLLSGYMAGVCYSEDGYNSIKQEDKEKTLKRLNGTYERFHFSVSGHVHLTLYIENTPKILAMVINNEKEYNTSEKSARYTKIDDNVDVENISSKEKELYNKWFEILHSEIEKEYKDVFAPRKIRTLSQENARYMVSVFMPTKMVYTTSFRQLNEIVALMNNYINNHRTSNDMFETKLCNSMEDLIENLLELNVIEEKLCTNPKKRELSLFNDNLDKKEEYFGDVYSTNYKATFAELAQAQRHRTLSYQIKRTGNKEFYVPEILQEKTIIKNEWIHDIESVAAFAPQGELIEINECGTYDNFILKLTERLCTNAQLEIMKQSRETLLKYKEELENKNHYLKDDIVNYTKGARCTFDCFKCPENCKFKEGKTLTRKI